jgi:hypothetical protein
MTWHPRSCRRQLQFIRNPLAWRSGFSVAQGVDTAIWPTIRECVDTTLSVFVSREIGAIRRDKLTRLTDSLPGHELLDFRFVESVSVNLVNSAGPAKVEDISNRTPKPLRSLVNREHFAPLYS